MLVPLDLDTAKANIWIPKNKRKSLGIDLYDNFLGAYNWRFCIECGDRNHKQKFVVAQFIFKRSSMFIFSVCNWTMHSENIN